MALFSRKVKMIYFDNAGTTKLSAKAKREMNKATKVYGNPSSLYKIGIKANKRLQEVRISIADSMQCLPEEIYFTSGGTESDNWAIESACEWGRSKGKTKIITTPFEHHAILNTLKEKEKEGFVIEYLPVYEDGIVHIADLRKLMSKEVCLVSVMYANNEIGTLQPIKEIAKLCKSKKVIFHTDAVQVVGHEQINLIELGVDMLSASAHKFHGPKGVGFLYCAKSCPLTPFIRGGAQERGKRAGTENVVGAVGMAVALKESLKNRVGKNIKIRKIRDYLVRELTYLPNIRVNGDIYTRLLGNINVCFKDLDGATLQLLLDDHNICVSNGSACTSGSMKASHVLEAIGVPKDYIHGNVRITIDEYNSMYQAKRFVKTLKKILRSFQETPKKVKKVKREGETNMNGQVLAYAVLKNGRYYAGEREDEIIWNDETGFIFDKLKDANKVKKQVDGQIITVFIDEVDE